MSDTEPDDASREAEASSALAAALAEYESLRGEIGWLIEHGAQLQNYAIGLAVGLFPVAAFILENGNTAFLVGLLIAAPIAFSLLGLLYFRQHQEVYVVAAYLKERARPIIRELSGRPDLWTWEEFKTARQSVLSSRSPVLGIWRPRTILVLRLAIFTLPAVCSLVLGLSVALTVGSAAMFATYTVAGSILLLILTVLDVMIVSMLGIRFWKEGDLSKVVLGESAAQRHTQKDSTR